MKQREERQRAPCTGDPRRRLPHGHRHIASAARRRRMRHAGRDRLLAERPARPTCTARGCDTHPRPAASYWPSASGIIDHADVHMLLAVVEDNAWENLNAAPIDLAVEVADVSVYDIVLRCLHVLSRGEVAHVGT